MAFTPQEIEKRASELIDAGVSKEDVVAFINKAKAEIEQPIPAQPASQAPVAAQPAAAPVQPMDPALMRAAAMAGGGGMVGGYPISGSQALRGAVTGGRMALEGGGTAVAQALAAPATVAFPPAVPAAGMAAAKFLNAVGQGVEYAVYGTPYNPIENEKATLMGGVPVMGPESMIAERLAASGLKAATPSAVVNALQFGGKLGTAGGLSEAAVETAATGELPEPSQIAMAAAVPFAAGTAGEYLASRGSNLVDRFGQISDSLAKFRGIGIEPTPGMVEPARFARFERAMIEKQKGGEVAQQVNKAYNQISENINATIPQTLENSTVYDAMLERSTGLAAKRAELDKLGGKVAAAQRDADSALTALGETRDKFYKDVVAANDQAMDQVNSAALENARRIAIQRAQGSTDPLSGAKARTALVSNVIKPMDSAYDVYWKRMYSMFPDKEKAFDTTPILKEAERIYGNYNLKVPGELKSILAQGAEEGEEEAGKTASLAALRNLRELLLKRGKISDADPTAMQNDLRRLGGFVTGEMDGQAARVFGEEGAKQFKAVQTDYKRYSDLWHKPGVEMLYVDNPTDDVVTKIVNGIKENGADADEYKNLRALIANLAEPQSARSVAVIEKVPQMVEGANTINQELAGRLASHVNDTIRANIFWQASKGGKVDPTALIGTLEKIGRDPEALRLLNLGTQADIDALAQLFKNNPQSNGVTPQQLSDAYLSVKLTGGERAFISELLAAPVKATQIENQLVKAVYDKGIGRLESAAKRLENAQKTAASLGISKQQVRARFDQMAADPLYNFFEKRGPLPAEGFNRMVQVMFSPNANAMTNRDVAQIFTHLRASPETRDRELLQNLQRSYLQDHLLKYAKAGEESKEGARVSVSGLMQMMAPAGRVAPRGELERMALVLEPEQMEAVRKTLDAAKDLRKYEQAGAGEEGRPLRMGYKFNIVKRGYEAIADMIVKGDYNRAVSALMEPEKYANSLAVRGQWMQAAGVPVKAIAPTINRFLPQPQVPEYLSRFSEPQPAR